MPMVTGSLTGTMGSRLPVTIVTMLDFDGNGHGDGDGLGTCKQTLNPNENVAATAAVIYTRQETLNFKINGIFSENLNF